MIAYIKGSVLYYINGGVVIENNGIGYEVLCSNSALVKLTNNKEGALYTYMQTREDGMFLYGFDNLQEKDMFLKLISVSGVGPKMGIAVLSAMNLSSLAVAIGSSDIKTLQTIKGLGKKTAERIIVELREKMQSLDIEPSQSVKLVAEPTLSKDDEDGVIALISLGFNKADSQKAVVQAKEQGATTIQDIITFALRSIK